MPAVALVDGSDSAQWQKQVLDLGWKVIAPEIPAGASGDQRALALTAQVEAAIKSGSVDPARIYLAGRQPRIARRPVGAIVNALVDRSCER